MQAESMRFRYLLRSLEETRTWGTSLGALLRSGDVIALTGDLGAGKTTLTQAIAAGMGIKDLVTSPTFALAQEYTGTIPLFHFDPYRLQSQEAFFDLGFEDYLVRDGVIVVEWAERVAELLPLERLNVTLTEVEDSVSDSETMRLLTAVASEPSSRMLLAELNEQPQIVSLLEPKP